MRGITRNKYGLFVPTSYDRATIAQRKEVCNGCGSAQAKFDFVPDNIWGMSITPACDAHDWGYYVGKTWRDKFIHDICFLNNMLVLTIRHGGRLRWLRYMRAIKYWIAVHEKGDTAYWASKIRPMDKRDERRAS